MKITPLPKLGMRVDGLVLGSPRQNVFVPDEHVLGEPGNAWYMLLPTLNNERIMVGAVLPRRDRRRAGRRADYMKQRKAFGGSSASSRRSSIMSPTSRPGRRPPS